MFMKRLSLYRKILKNINRLSLLDVMLIEKYVQAVAHMRNRQTMTKE